MPHPTFADAKTALASGETSLDALVSSFLDTIRERDDDLNAFLYVDEDSAHDQAKSVEARRAAGETLPLAGMVMGVKDVLCTKGEQVTCGSRILEGFRSLYDATAVTRLREAGAVLVGKTNCDEFAMGSSNETSYYGATRNPVHRDYVPGGSSGGSAAAVGADLCHTSLGTDTGGSIRQPAAFTGTVGLKPTYGRVSRYGLVAYASSFDSIGPFAHTVEDAAHVLQAIAGRDEKDSTSASVAVPDYSAALGQDVRGMRVGLPREFFDTEGLDADVRRLVMEQVDRLRDGGAEIVDVSLPHTRYGIATYYVLTTAEASSNLARYDGVRYGYRADMDATRAALASEARDLGAALKAAEADGDAERAADLADQLERQDSILRRLYTETRSQGFGAEVKRRIMLGTYVLSSGYYDAYYAKAQRVRNLIKHDYDAAFADVDVLLTPATPTPAFEIGSIVDDPLTMYLNDIYTVTANLAGVPGLVVPVGGHPSGLPIGLQLIAPHFEESRLLRAGDWVMRQ